MIYIGERTCLTSNPGLWFKVAGSSRCIAAIGWKERRLCEWVSVFVCISG